MAASYSVQREPEKMVLGPARFIVRLRAINLVKIFNFGALYLGAQGAAAETMKISNSKSRVLYRFGQVSFEKLTVRFGYFP